MVSPHILNIHGHLHASYLDSKNHMTASIHMINYKPLTLRQVQSYIDRQLPKHETEFLYEWYADKQILTERSRSDLILSEDGRIDLERTRELYKTTRGDKKSFYYEIRRIKIRWRIFKGHNSFRAWSITIFHYVHIKMDWQF